MDCCFGRGEGGRIVVTSVLRDKVVQTAHASHQGICKTKALIRESVWFPGIDKRVEAVVRDCLPCQATLDNNVIEPLRTMSDLPDSPWSEIAMDFCGPMQDGEYLMVVIDEYSRYPEVELINSTSSQTVIRHLDAIFSRHGIPSVLKIDNGPPFQSTDFAQFAL